jgi:hypothetical protein
MFDKLIFLASYGAFSGGGFGDLLSKLEDAGFFSYIVPFLLLFAIVFGILTKTKIFQENKAVNGIISFSVALMALQFDFVSQFFSQLFPRLGIGLAVILVILILIGLFTDPGNEAINWVLFGIAVVIIGAVLLKTSNALGWSSIGDWFSQNLGMIIAGGVIIAIIAIIMNADKPKNPKQQPFSPILWKQ